MRNPEEFDADREVAWVESFLTQQPLRLPPAEWRAEILGQAEAAAPSEIPNALPVQGLAHWLSCLNSGWTVTGAAWALVWALNMYAGRPGGEVHVVWPRFSDQLMAEQQAFQKGLVDS